MALTDGQENRDEILPRRAERRWQVWSLAGGRGGARGLARGTPGRKPECAEYVRRAWPELFGRRNDAGPARESTSA